MILENTDFLCEKRLKEIDFGLHMVYKNSVFATDRILAKYKSVFPYFTNHTYEHSEKVISYCNELIGEENIEKLNADEIYILHLLCGFPMSLMSHRTEIFSSITRISKKTIPIISLFAINVIKP